MRGGFVESVIAEKVVAVKSGAEHRGVELRSGTGCIELERHAEVNGCGRFDAAPSVAVAGLPGIGRNNVERFKVELAETDVGRNTEHGAKDYDVERVLPARPAAIESVAASERRNRIKQVKLGRDYGSERVTYIHETRGKLGSDWELSLNVNP